ncbi:MAG: hypothetical protein Q7P63_16405 [Verrucomicrobiota bacterium JB022]|nr:hypothetical protein [Verrucomicrobiota bacterium JB022]
MEDTGSPFPPRLHFVHLPKCAGTALYQALLEAWQVAPAEVPPYFPMEQHLYSVYHRRHPNSYAEAEAGMLESLETLLGLYYEAGYRVIGAHHPFSPNLFAQFRQEVVSTTVLREPLARIRSHVLYNIFLNRSADPETKRAKDVPFDALAELQRYLDSDRLPHIADTYAKKLGGVSPEGSVDLNLRRATERAFAAIDLIDVVGLLEHMPAYLQALEERTGRKIQIRSANTTAEFADDREQYRAAKAYLERPEIDALLRPYIQQDEVIYAYARWRLGHAETPPVEALERLEPYRAFFGSLLPIEDSRVPSWAGEMVLATFPWVFHRELGWLKLIGQASAEEFWVERHELGELCLRTDTYPRLYRKGTNSWLLASPPGSGNAAIWDFAREAWIS